MPSAGAIMWKIYGRGAASSGWNICTIDRFFEAVEFGNENNKKTMDPMHNRITRMRFCWRVSILLFSIIIYQYHRVVFRSCDIFRPGSFQEFPDFSIFAQVSLSVTVRLNTGFPGVESGSAQKYPIRSNWNLSPGLASPSDGSR